MLILSIVLMQRVLILMLVSTMLLQPLLALEVDREVMPRMTIGGRVMSTVDSLELDSEPSRADGVNLADSSLLLRFDKRTYVDGVAGAVIGLSENDTQLRFHQLNTFYWNRNYRVEIGRTRLRNTLLEFPLLRDDDLLDYTHVGNASSNTEVGQIYGEQVAFDWFVDQKLQKLSAWGGTRSNDEANPSAPNGLDSYGFGYVYEQPEDLRYVTWVRHAGLLVDRQKLNIAGDTQWLTAVVAGIEWNLNMHPAANWSAATQLIVNAGADEVGGLESVMTRAAAKSTTFVASVRYTARPKLLTRWQAAIAFAFKDYADVTDASQWSIVPNLVYRLGQGTDIFGQVKYTNFGDEINEGGSDASIQVGLAFSLEAIFNDNIGERNSILNLEHGYIQ